MRTTIAYIFYILKEIYILMLKTWGSPEGHFSPTTTSWICTGMWFIVCFMLSYDYWRKRK